MTVPPRWQVLELLASTPVSRTWRVALPEQLAVLREDEPGARHLKLDRAAEPGVLRAAAAAGLGPACLEADPEAGRLLTAWLPGRAWSAADLKEPANLDRAAALLRRLHGMPLAAGLAFAPAFAPEGAPTGAPTGRSLPVVDLGRAIERYAALAGPAFAAPAAAARLELATCRDEDPAPPCLCHNDPTPGNFIAGPDGSLRLIDWEYAGLGHPGFDLAGLAVGADLTPAQVARLHTAYRQRPPTAAELRRHRGWERLCRRVGTLWAAALARSPTRPAQA